MMIKTLDNVYINMEDFSGFTIGYPNDSDFTVMAMKELVDESDKNIDGKYRYEINCMYEIELENGEIINVYEDEINPDYKEDYTE